MIAPITTPRLTLRRFRPEDADDLYAYLADPQIYRFEPGEPIDREQAGVRAADMAASPDFWAVALRSTGRVIGQVYLAQLDPAEHLTCELGYILSPAYQGQGYGSEAAAALVAQALTAGGMHRVVAHCNPENTASWKLLEKIGFRREGLFRQDVFFRRNAAGEPLWTDTYVYARLAADETGMPQDRAELLIRIRRGWSTLLQEVADLALDQMLRAAPGEWSIKDHLAHLAAWERYLLLHHLQGHPSTEVLQISAAEAAAFDIDRMNAILRERSREQPADEVFAELHRNHARLLAALETLDEAALAHPGPADDLVDRPLVESIAGNTYEHYPEHLAAMRALATRS